MLWVVAIVVLAFILLFTVLILRKRGASGEVRLGLLGMRLEVKIDQSASSEIRPS